MRLIQTKPYDTYLAKKMIKSTTGKDCLPVLDEKDLKIIHFYMDKEETNEDPQLIATYNRYNGDMVIY